jgi:hypothetical protein
MFSALLSPVAGNRQTSRLRRCSAFSRLRCVWIHVDEQAFIFVPKFRVQVAQHARRISDGAILRAREMGELRFANPPWGAARKQKVSQSFQADLPGPASREKTIRFARDPNQS